MFTFNYHYNDEDYLRYNISNLRHSKHGKSTMRLFRIIIPVVSITVNLLDMLKQEQSDFFYLIGLIISMIISILVLELLVGPFMRLVTKLSIKKMSKGGKLPYSKEGSLTVDDDGIRDNQPDSTSLYRWETVQNIDVVIPDGIYVYVGVSQAVIMMTNAIFGNEEQKAAFIDFAKSKIGAEKIMYYKK